MEGSELISAATPFIKPIWETFIAPKLKKFEKRLKKMDAENQVLQHQIFEDVFNDYLNKNFNNVSYINTLVFPNQQIKLKDIYLPVSIRKLVPLSEYDKKIKTKFDETYKIDEKTTLSFLLKYKKILIRDRAGMGKSTLMKYINLLVINKKIGIPVYVELRKLNKNHNLFDEIKYQLRTINHDIDDELIIKLLELGEFIVMLDGYDEIITSDRHIVTSELLEFISSIENNYFILTSRPEDSLVSFGGFQLFQIVELGDDEIVDLLKTYDKISQSNIAESITKELNEHLSIAKELLTIPFLVSLLYRAYNFNRNIPAKRVSFFEEIFLALYKSHDLTKNAYKRSKLSNLDIVDFRIILRELGFISAQYGKVEFTYNDLHNYIMEISTRNKIEVIPSKYIDDLLLTVPIFIKEGTIIKWSHKSFQDFFAAEYISTAKNKSKILERIYDSRKQKYLSILDLYIEMDLLNFRQTILMRLLEDYVQYFNDTEQQSPEDKKVILRVKQYSSFGDYFQLLLIDILVHHNIIYDTVSIYSTKNGYYSSFIRAMPKWRFMKKLLDKLKDEIESTDNLLLEM